MLIDSRHFTDRRKATVKRRYDITYIKYVFSFIVDKMGERPQCVLCSEVLAQESMKPSKLVRHLETKHPSHKDKPVEYFQRRLKDLRASQVSYIFVLEEGTGTPCILPGSTSYCQVKEAPHHCRGAYLTCSYGYGERGF